MILSSGHLNKLCIYYKIYNNNIKRLRQQLSQTEKNPNNKTPLQPEKIDTHKRSNESMKIYFVVLLFSDMFDDCIAHISMLKQTLEPRKYQRKRI